MTGPEAPSTVMTALPAAVAAGVWHDLVLRPSISTVHAAHCPIPQPYFGPCSSSTSRSTHSSGLPAKRSSTSTSAPFTFSFTTTSWIERVGRGRGGRGEEVSLSGLALVDPLLKRVHLAGGPRAVARHLPAAQGAGDGVGVLDDIVVIEQVKGTQHRVPVLRAEQGLDVPLEAEPAVICWHVTSSW